MSPFCKAKDKLKNQYTFAFNGMINEIRDFSEV